MGNQWGYCLIHIIILINSTQLETLIWPIFYHLWVIPGVGKVSIPGAGYSACIPATWVMQSHASGEKWCREEFMTNASGRVTVQDPGVLQQGNVICNEKLYIIILLYPERDGMFQSKWPWIQDFHHKLGSFRVIYWSGRQHRNLS